MMEHNADEILARRAREGSIESFEQLFERYKKPILNFVYRIVENRETAEEVTQEAFIKVYKNLDTYDPERKFSSWLFTIARNLSKNSIRDRKYFRGISLDKPLKAGEESLKLMDVIRDPGVSPDEIARSRELAREAKHILSLLPIKYREIIALCSVQGLPQKDAAEVLGCSVATVSVRLRKAKKIFIKKLGI